LVFRDQHDNSDRSSPHLLLISEVSVPGHQHIETAFDGVEQWAIIQIVEASVLGGFDWKVDMQCVLDAPGNTDVDQDAFHRPHLLKLLSRVRDQVCCAARLLDHGDRVFARYTGKVCEEIIQGFAGLEIVEQRLHGHTPACETRLAAETIRRRRRQWGWQGVGRGGHI
jgi:hypothetical protein